MNFRKLLPYDNYVLTTRLSVEEVRSRIKASIEPKRFYMFRGLFKRRPVEYEGVLLDDQFEINRIIYYRNSFVPLIRGEISNFLDRTQVTIKMRPYLSVLIFISIWLGVTGIICLIILGNFLMQFKKYLDQGFSPPAVIPFAMFLFGYGILIFGYKFESVKSKKFLAELLEGEEETSA